MVQTYLKAGPLHFQVNQPPRIFDFTQAQQDGALIAKDGKLVPIVPAKANLKDPKINKAQIEAGQNKIEFLKTWKSNRIDPQALSVIESIKIPIDEQNPGCLAVTVEGVRRIPKGVEPLVFATKHAIKNAKEQLLELQKQFCMLSDPTDNEG